jgi:glycosyltransferase involved in cell wall biosynthesis
MPKVSVIIPTYNRSLYLQKVIESILNQKYKDYEMVIVDNASTDGTENMVNSFDDKRIRYFRNVANVGMTNNYNLALGYSTGEYICVFSDDDIMHENNLQQKVKVLDNYSNVSLVHSNVRVIDGGGNVNSSIHWAVHYYEDWWKVHYKNNMFNGLDYLKILINHWNVICMPSVMLRRLTVEKMGKFDSNIYYTLDWDMWLRSCLYGDVYYLRDPLVDYRVHQSNTIREITNKKFEEELTIIKSKIRNLLF